MERPQMCRVRGSVERSSKTWMTSVAPHPLFWANAVPWTQEAAEYAGAPRAEFQAPHSSGCTIYRLRIWPRCQAFWQVLSSVGGMAGNRLILDTWPSRRVTQGLCFSGDSTSVHLPCLRGRLGRQVWGCRDTGTRLGPTSSCTQCWARGRSHPLGWHRQHDAPLCGFGCVTRTKLPA